MDFFRDSLVLVGSTSHGHISHEHGSNNLTRQRSRKKSQSHGGRLQPLRQLLREPIAALGSFIGDTSISGARTLHVPSITQDDQYQGQVLRLRLLQAETHNDWISAATELDHVQGRNDWKLEEESAEYDAALVRLKLQQLDEARLSGDQARILLLVRTAFTRNLGNMGSLRLYKHSRVGTKVLIERYIESALDTIDTLVRLSKSGKSTVEPQKLLHGIVCARQSFGRSALLLSGGGTFGMNHIGVVKSLYEAHLLPRIISGASAGSIVCAVLCTKTDAEIPGVLNEFCNGDLAVFEKEGEGTSLLGKAYRFLTKGALFDISNLVRVMHDMLGDMTFQEAYNRTRRILNICVSTASLYELPRLLNYVTAPNVMIWSAVAASCSVPLIYSAAQLLAKDPKTGEQVPWNQTHGQWIDGSVDNDLPMTRLAEMFNVNHFIVSQVNPHVVPFLEKDEEELASEARQSDASYAAGPSWLHTMAQLAKGEALHRMQVLSELGVLPNTLTKVRSVLGQRYSGDITIFPQIPYSQFPRVLTNPTHDFMVQAMLSGERATWPKLTEIRNHCAIELALDDAVHSIMTTVAFSPSQVDLRRMSALNSSDSPSHGHRRRTRRVSQSALRNSSDVHRTSIDRKQADRARKSYHDLPSLFLSGLASAKVAGPPDPNDHDEPSSELDSLHPSMTSASGSDDEGYGEGSYSSSSFDMPPSPLPRLWPSTRQLFPSASQPATPTIASSAFGLSSAHASAAALASAAVSLGPSSPELRYKNLFHNVKLTALPTIESDTPPSSVGDFEPVDRGSRKAMSPGLEIDISGTRGMVRRRKRSLSTGMRGLWPPGTQ